jgi:hypothetical protein
LGARWGWVVNASIRPIYPPGMTHNPLYSRLGGSKNRAGQVRKFSPNPEFDPWIFQPIAAFKLLLTKRCRSDDYICRERKWHSYGLLSLRRPDSDIDRFMMVKMFRQILSVPSRRTERFDVCTFELKMRKSWNLKNRITLKSEEGWQF